MITEEGYIEFVNFMTPGLVILVLRCDNTSFTVKINNFYEIHLLYSQVQIRQTEGIYLMFQDWFSKT